jgi:myo-inositol-1(or 4)-monophosphatase
VEPAELLEVASEAARAAAPLLLERFGSEKALRAKSSATDMVSEADIDAEAAIRAVLARRVPDDAIVGEEGGSTVGSSGRSWLVDPLDGTTNYLYGLPQWSISIACEQLAAVVLDPVRDELFAASEDGPATLNSEPLQPRPAVSLERALVATGFGYEAAVRAEQGRVAAELLPRVRDIRRAGSAALDLCWLAAGRLDAYYERGVKPWDVAAGELICARAGLEVVDLPATGALPAGVLVAAEPIVAELLPLMV